MAIASACDFASLRAKLRLDLIDAATELGVPVETVRSWDEGESSVPERIMRTLGVLADFSPRVELGTSCDLNPSVGNGGDKEVPAFSGRERQAQLGQFMTQPTVARFMAGLFDDSFPDHVRLLDAGAGRAALTHAFVERWRRHGAGCLSVHAYEADSEILAELADKLATLASSNVDPKLIEGDFIAQTAMGVRSGNGPRYTHAILNPPYRKIGSTSSEREYLRIAGIETVNLYSGFVWLALQMLEEGGELVAIIPRSFCNGPYYAPFRHSLLKDAALLQLHLFEARNRAFRKDKVLQENIIIHVRRGVGQGNVLISTSQDDTFADYSERFVSFDRIVLPDDEQQFIHVPTSSDRQLDEWASFKHSLDDVGVKVSTGPVVDFRLKQYLRPDPGPDTVPLLYPGHFAGGELRWPRSGFRKANAIARTRETEKWLYPSGCYTVVRRFSAKEERRRIVANVVAADLVPGEMLGFENHLNVFHAGRGPLAEDLARGLAIFLNSSVVDRWFRRFNGHTQVNATDLRAMRYPSRAQLEALGRGGAQPSLSQQDIDKRIEQLE
jgi:hypothetical protein